jgi:hypothetical protein
MPDALEVDIYRIQYIAIVGSLVVLGFILELIRKKKIKEEFSLLWLFSGMVFLIFSFWRRGLEVLAIFLGIGYAPAALFLLLIMAIYIILIHYSVILSELAETSKTLVQEVGLLKFEIQNIRKQQASQEEK